jgi:hypothetical protein
MKNGNGLKSKIFLSILMAIYIFFPVPTFAGNILSSRHTLYPGKNITSSNGQYQLILQEDGNLVLYSNGNALWSSRTMGKGAKKLVMQRDGNLVLYKDREPVWATNTSGNNGAFLKIQNDGNLVIYRAVWSTGTAH